MSNTNRGPVYRSDVVKIITSRASKLIKGSGENNGNIRRLAQSVVNQFYHILDPNLRMNFAQRVVIARDMAVEQLPELFKDLNPKEVDAGMQMGTKALELSSKIQQRETSVTKAAIHMRRDVDARRKKEKESSPAKARFSAQRENSLATSPSPKQRFKHPHGRRKAA